MNRSFAHTLLLCVLLAIAGMSDGREAGHAAIADGKPDRNALYIVVLQPLAAGDAPFDVTKFGGQLEHRAGSRVAVRLPEAAVEAVRHDPKVRYVQRVITGYPVREPSAGPHVDHAARTSAAATGIRPHAVMSHGTDSWTAGVYTYDGAGNVWSVGPSSAGATDRFTYDRIGRLSSATVNSGTTVHQESYQYDDRGNLTQIVTDNVTVGLPADTATNRLSSTIGMQYDAAGHLTASPVNDYYRYDQLGMLNQDNFPGQTYIYNASDERIAIAPWNGDFDRPWRWTLRDLGGQRVREFESFGADGTEYFVWLEDHFGDGARIIASQREAAEGGRRHFHVDHLGTTRLVTNGVGQRISSHDYFPYGVEVTSVLQERTRGYEREQALRFTGHERDGLESYNTEHSVYLDYMHARYYNPNWGRFLSVDPAPLVAARRPQTWNRYSYSLNNPINLVDPTGLWPTKSTLGVGGTVHQNAIDRAFPFMESRWRSILKRQQIVADREQATSLSYRHAMRAPGQSAAEARELANVYVRTELLLAIKAQGEGSFVAAMEHLGLAIHTLQDETSPMHKGFQEWEGMLHAKKAADHVAGENYDPGRGSELDAVTRKAWDWFVSKKVPDDVFEPNRDSYCWQCPTTIFGIPVP